MPKPPIQTILHETHAAANNAKSALAIASALFVAILLALSLSTLTFTALTLTGCDAANQDFRDIFHFGIPDPPTAAAWMFHRDPEKRRLGISLISNAPFGGEPTYLEVYRKAVTDTDALVRAAAVQALGLHGIGNDAELVAPRLEDQSQMVRWEAARALQRLHNPAVIDPLVKAMLHDDDGDVRMAAANALGQYKEPRVVDALLAALDDRSLSVNRNARRSLRILTGRDFGTDREKWIRWTRSTEELFKNGTQYHYPVYSRPRSWYEKYTPIGSPEFESPGKPRPTVEAANPAQENTEQTPPSDNNPNTNPGG